LAGAALALLVTGAAALCCVAVLPRAFGYTPLVVRSGSMGAAIPVGSLVLAAPVADGDVRVGDPIVVPGSAGRDAPAVLHRVVALTDREGVRVATLKGDANPAPDPRPVPLAGSTLRPVRVLPYVGYAVATTTAWVRTAALLGLLAVPAVLLMRRRSVQKDFAKRVCKVLLHE
jgi:signal peptidase